MKYHYKCKDLPQCVHHFFIQGVLKPSWKPNYECVISFTVRTIVDLNTIPKAAVIYFINFKYLFSKILLWNLYTCQHIYYTYFIRCQHSQSKRNQFSVGFAVDLVLLQLKSTYTERAMLQMRPFYYMQMWITKVRQHCLVQQFLSLRYFKI
jgi:hypothetical protein